MFWGKGERKKEKREVGRSEGDKKSEKLSTPRGERGANVKGRGCERKKGDIGGC